MYRIPIDKEFSIQQLNKKIRLAIDRWRDRQMGRQTDEEIDRWSNRQMERWAAGQSNRGRDRQMDGDLVKFIDKKLEHT